jgi:hypothetical protein
MSYEADGHFFLMAQTYFAPEGTFAWCRLVQKPEQ